jgi:hypothetical protein
MPELPETPGPMIGLGMTSLVLGVIALLVFFMPVLGIPISVLGLGFGLLGCVAAFFARDATLRWSLGGIAICALALAVNVALNYAPSGYLPGDDIPKSWRVAPDRPYVPPPAE